MGLKSHAAVGVRWTTLSSVFTTASEVLRTIVLARFLSPVDFGLMAMVTVVTGFAQMYTDLGISAAIIHRQDATKDHLSSLYWLNIFTGLAVFGVVWVCAPCIPLFFREPRLLPLLKVVAIVFLITPLGSQFELLLQKELSFRVLAKQEIVASLGSTILACVCAVAGLGVWALVYSFLGGIILKTALLVRIGFARFQPSLHFRRSDLKGYIGFGLYQIGERSINYLSQRLDQIVIGPLLGAQALGFYSFAFNLSCKPIWRINPILTRVAFPLFSKVQDDRERLRRGYVKLLSFLSIVNAPLLIGLAAVAPWAVPTIFGAKWAKSIVLIQILSLVSLLRSLGNPIGSLQLAKGRADLGFKWTLFCLVVSVPAIFGGGHLGGATGIAVALLLLQIFLQVPAYLYLVRSLIGECAREYSSAILKPFVTASAMALTVIFVPPLLSGLSGILVLTVQLAIGGSAYLLLLRLFHTEVFLEFRNLILGDSAAFRLVRS